jgi:phage terminase small subunit
MGKLTKKQELFVKEYLIDLNATQAAIRAGYSKKTSYSIGEENLKKPVIAAAIQEAMDKRAKRIDVNADYVLNTIVDTVERCRQAVPVYEKIDGEMQKTGEYEFDSGAVLKGCELLGKHLKLFTEKMEVSVTDNLAERLRRAKGEITANE